MKEKKEAQLLSVTRTQARQNLPALLDRVERSGGPVYINERGQNQAVLISMSEYEKLYRRRFEDNPMYGMWKDRKDMKDSVKWQNQLREKQSNRYKKF